MPEGVHRLSLYETNKDGHNDDNRLRDYGVDLLPYRAKLDDALTLPPLAHARVHDFWNGVYTSFLVRGPARYYVHIAKNGSHNTLLSGLFLDKVTGPVGRSDNSPMAAMFNVSYKPPDQDAPPPVANVPLPQPPPPTASQLPVLRASRSLWDTLDAAQEDADFASLQTSYRLLSYRAAIASAGSEHLQENWRWHLHIWTEGDRLWFQRKMASATSMKSVTPATY